MDISNTNPITLKFSLEDGWSSEIKINKSQIFRDKRVVGLIEASLFRDSKSFLILTYDTGFDETIDDGINFAAEQQIINHLLQRPGKHVLVEFAHGTYSNTAAPAVFRLD